MQQQSKGLDGLQGEPLADGRRAPRAPLLLTAGQTTGAGRRSGMAAVVPRSRVVGVDVARCLALLGMMATHILPGVVDGDVPLGFQLAAGRASALFAVLAGVSLVLVGGREPLRGRAWTGMRRRHRSSGPRSSGCSGSRSGSSTPASR